MLTRAQKTRHCEKPSAQIVHVVEIPTLQAINLFDHPHVRLGVCSNKGDIFCSVASL